MTQQIVGRQMDALLPRQFDYGSPAVDWYLPALLPAVGTRAVATEGLGYRLETPERLDERCVVHAATISRLPRRFKREISLSQGAPVSRQGAAMPAKSHADETPEAAAIMAAQSARLRRLRSVLSKSQAAAAREAGLSKDAWNRMETGEHKLNTVALARWAELHDVAIEYVISGRLIGLKEHQVRLISALEAQEAASDTSPARSQAPQAAEPSRTTSEKSTPGKAKRPALIR